MRNLSTHRFRSAATLLGECQHLMTELYDGKPATPLSAEELEAAGRLAELCYAVLWILCDNARVNMDDELNPNELMANLWKDDPHNPTSLMGTLWAPRKKD